MNIQEYDTNLNSRRLLHLLRAQINIFILLNDGLLCFFFFLDIPLAASALNNHISSAQVLSFSVAA